MTAAVPTRARHRPDAAEGISASELLARYADAGFDRPSRSDRRAAELRHESLGHEPVDAPGDPVVTRDTPAGLGADGIGLIRGRTSQTGTFGRNPRAVAATMGATLVGATAVMGVVTALDAPDEAAADLTTTPVDKAGAEQATMTLTAVGGQSAAGSLGQAPAGVPAAFQQADAARIASNNLAAARKAADQQAAADRKTEGGGGGEDSAPPPVQSEGSSAGLQALALAKTKLGAPYKWGATGPSAFDCSGLMVWAFEQVGQDLPRSSAAQAKGAGGQSVSKDELQPGDIVFFYSPVSHVGIYAGNGKILHASQSGDPVKYSDIDRMPFNSAQRL